MAGRILTSALYVAGLIIFYIGAARIVRHLGRNNPKVLLYHDCAPAETDYTAGLDCTTTPDKFARHLDYLARHYRVVDIEDLVAGTAGASAVAITFDDGYRSVYEYALPRLEAHGFPATVYLISDVVGNADLVWVNELLFALRTAPEAAFALTDKYFSEAPRAGAIKVIDYCRLHYDVKKMAALLAALRSSLKLPVEEHATNARLYLDWDEIELMRQRRIAFGNHTRTHPNLERLGETEQRNEIAAAQRALDARMPDVRSFAYPFGHHSPDTARIAAQCGLRSVMEVGGYNDPVSRSGIGRVHLADQSVAGLFSRMEVVEPIKGALRAFLRQPQGELQMA